MVFSYGPEKLLHMMASIRDGILSAAIIISMVLCSATEVYKVRSCSGEEAVLSCSSGLYVDVVYGFAGFGPSGTHCTSTASCKASYLTDALEGWKTHLEEHANDICKNKQTCRIRVKSSWQGGGTDCDNQLYKILYAELYYKCSSLKYTVRTCSGEEAVLSCSSGLYVHVVYGIAGFGPSGTPCTSTASCTTTYVAYDRGVSLLVKLAKDVCKNKHTCRIMVKSSWQGGTSDCHNYQFRVIYAELVYQCSPEYTVRSCAGQVVRLNCSSGLHVDVVSAIGGFASPGSACTSRATSTAVYVKEAIPEIHGNLAAFFLSACKSEHTCDLIIPSSWETECNSQLYNLVFVDVEYNCASLKYKVRLCAGHRVRLNCSSGDNVDVISAVGGFGPSGRPCTSTASCTRLSVLDAIPGLHGNILAYALYRCRHKQTCTIPIDSNWSVSKPDHNNQGHKLIYADVTFKCSTPSPGTTSTTVTPVPSTKSIPLLTGVSTTKNTRAVTPVPTIRSTMAVATTAITSTMISAPIRNSTSEDVTPVYRDSEWIYYVFGAMGAVVIILIIVITLTMLLRKRTTDVNRAEIVIDNLSANRIRQDTNTTTSCVDSDYEHLGQPSEAVTSFTQASQSNEVDNVYTTLKDVKQ